MPSFSPRTQQMQMGAGAGEDQTTALFEKGFSDLAYSVLMNKLPDIVQDVVTFKILETDIDTGMGVGCFVLMRNEQPVYIPVVMSDNAIKPLELVYHKALNVFLPLTKQWLDELDKTTLNSLGGGVKTPESLYSDVDIKNVVVPPITGRFSYAALMEDVKHVMTPAFLEKTAEPKQVLLEFLEKAPNSVKTAFAKVIRKRPKLAKHAARIYGVKALSAALTPHADKVAHSSNGGLWFVDKTTKIADFERVFGDRAGEAYAGVRRKGFAARDERQSKNEAIEEHPGEWQEPGMSGVYTLFGTNATEKTAYILKDPVDLMANGSRYSKRPIVPGHNPLVPDRTDTGGARGIGDDGRKYRIPGHRPNDADYALHQGVKYVALLPNGDYLEAQNLVGRDSAADDVAGGSLTKLFTDAGTPRVGVGCFVRAKGVGLHGTLPVQIKSISTGTDGIRRMTCTAPGMDWHEKQVIMDPKGTFGNVWTGRDSDIAVIPPDYVWVPLKAKRKNNEFFASALDAQAFASRALSAAGARKVSIKNASAGQFSIDGSYALDRVACIKKLAYDYILAVPVAEALLEKAAAERNVSVWVAPMEKLARVQLWMNKQAGDDDKDKDKKKSPPKKEGPPADGAAPPVGGDPMMGADPMADPAMAGMDPSMGMAPPAPPPPTPSDLASMEMQQQIEQEMQKLQEKMQLVQMLAARSNEIAGGAPVMPTVQTQAMGAPPPSMNMATGQPMPGGIQPPAGGPPGALGGAMPGAPMGGMPPDPAMGGMPPDPTMGGAMSAPMGGGMEGMAAGPAGALPMDPMSAGDPSMMGGTADPMAGGMAGGMGDPSMGGMPMDPASGGMAMDPSMGGAGMDQVDPTTGQPMQPSMAMMGPEGPGNTLEEGEVNPQFLEQAAQLQSDDVFDAAAVATLAQSPAVKELAGQYLPNLEKALDNIARVQLGLWIQEPGLKGEIGEATFATLEESLRNTFKSMGDLVLKLSQGAHAIKGPFDNATT